MDSIAGIKLVEQIRHRFKNVYIQGFDSEVIFGLQHVVEDLKITLEALKRQIMVANRPELDLLLRIACTTQISKAINHAGIKSGKCACFVIFSKNKRHLIKARNCALQSLPDFDNSEFVNDASTRSTLATKLGFKSDSFFLADDSVFLKYLIERAALITK